MAPGAGTAGPHGEYRRAVAAPARRQGAAADRLDTGEPLPWACALRRTALGGAGRLERPPGADLHREPRRDEALPTEHPGAGHRGHGPGGRAHRGDRRASQLDSAEGDPEALQHRSGQGPASHSAGDRRGSGRPELPGPLHRPVPLRPALEPGPDRAEERPHRPQAAARRRRYDATTSSCPSGPRTASSKCWSARRRGSSGSWAACRRSSTTMSNGSFAAGIRHADAAQLAEEIEKADLDEERKRVAKRSWRAPASARKT